jgi:hypothetical protein
MKPRAFSLLLATVASLFLAGCIQGTLRERNGSFSLYTQNRLGLESTKDFLTSCTARLFSAEHLTITFSATNPCVFSFQTSDSTIVIGCATAVDRRGYFLTVAHAVGREPPWLVFGVGNRLQAKRARVVWRGEVSKGEPDLALLCVPCGLEQVFEWGPHFSPGDRVLGAGLDYDSLAGPKLVCFAGMLKGSETSSEARAHARAVFHTAPLHHGDSGGPLVDWEGRLIGINVKASKEFSLLHPLGRRLNRTEHPDLRRLQQLIERDAGMPDKQWRRGTAINAIKQIDPDAARAAGLQ